MTTPNRTERPPLRISATVAIVLLAILVLLSIVFGAVNYQRTNNLTHKYNEQSIQRNEQTKQEADARSAQTKRETDAEVLMKICYFVGLVPPSAARDKYASEIGCTPGMLTGPPPSVSMTPSPSATRSAPKPSVTAQGFVSPLPTVWSSPSRPTTAPTLTPTPSPSSTQPCLVTVPSTCGAGLLGILCCHV